MKRVGILTEYYKSNNYGGVLQAYALCRFLNQNYKDINAEQIPYKENHKYRQRLKNAKSLKAVLIILYEMYLNEYKNIKPYRKHFGRIMSFSKFRKEDIPHNKRVYSDNSLCKCVDMYDVFIVGSDQVWRPKYKDYGYTLSFVPSSKTKISYAASMAVDSLTEAQELLFENTLKRFNAISVREQKAVELLQPLTDKPVELLVDPVLLLTKEQWDEVASKREIKGDYILTYFLGYNEKACKITYEFAKAHEYKVVFIPDIYCRQNKYHCKFCDICLYDISPQDFIALVKNAKYIFTDSFHATVFSNIYEKEYFIFNRDEKAKMSSRIFGITSLFGTENRFCYSDERMTVDYLNSVENIDYSKPNQELLTLKKRSIDFLDKALSE